MKKQGYLLIVDDEKELVENLELLIEDSVNKISCAYDGKEALNLIEKESKNIDCILCDVNMPKMGGVELLKTIREKEIETPFIFYTGHGSDELMLEVVKYGVFDFLNKPNFDGLNAVIERAIDWKLNGMNEKDKAEFMDTDSYFHKITNSLKEL